MATSKLWVHVLRASVKDSDTAPLYVYLRVGGSTDKTAKLAPPEPQWDYDCVFEVDPNDVFGSVILELYRTKLFVLSDLMGQTTIPLASIRHSNKKGEGVWHKLMLPSEGKLLVTEHRLCVDLHFELPPDLPEDIAEVLDKKLRKLDNVLQQEVEIIEKQSIKIVTGELASAPEVESEDLSTCTAIKHVTDSPPVCDINTSAQSELLIDSPPVPDHDTPPQSASTEQVDEDIAPPTDLANVPSYPFLQPSRSPSLSSVRSGSVHSFSQSPSPDPMMHAISPSMIHQTDTGSDLALDSVIEVQIPDSSYEDLYEVRRPQQSFDSDDMDFPNFDWVRPSKQTSTPKKVSENGASSRGSLPIPRRERTHSNSLDRPPKSGDHRRNSSLDMNKLHPQTASLSRLESRKRTGSDPSKVSPLVQHHSRSEGGNGASARRKGLQGTSDLERAEGSNISTASSMTSIDSNTSASVSGKNKSVVMRWKKAYEKQLPEIRERMKSEKSSFAGLSGSGAITLVELVDQLQNYKKLSNMGPGRDDLTDSAKYFSTINTEFRSRSRSVKKIRRRKHFIDEDLRVCVYKRTMEALIYPASEPDNHKFETWSARKPTNCSECSSLLWGLHKQGVRCARCGKICHERCSTLASQDCFIHDQELAISDKMQRMEVNHANRFQLLREAFNVPTREHEVVTKGTKDKILKMAQNFSAEVTVRVIGSQGLQLKDSDHKVYVSVAIGSERKRTKAFKRTSEDKSPPYWNEEFSFLCYNYHDAIQIRVWVERDTALSKVAQRLTKERDTFLGEKIIEVRRVGPPQDVWYKLAKRTTSGPEVGGHIKLSIAAHVEGDDVATPFHQQYMKLHEQLFLHCHLNCNEPLVPIPTNPPSDDDVFSVKFLPTVSQEIIDEFALRYAIEPIYRMMVHIELLVNHHSLKTALTMIDCLLKNLKFKMFLHVAADHASRAVGATVLMEEYMDASNFGRDDFSKLLDKLMTSLKLDLQQYREFYPPNDQQKLNELTETCQLMETVLEFQQQAMGVACNAKLEDLILENMKECVKSTFDFIVQNSILEENNTHPALSTAGAPFHFFYSVLKQIKAVINEDKKVYAPSIQRFCPFNLGDVSANELWSWFSNTIDGLFDNPATLEVFPPKEYISLFFIVRGLYESEIRRLPQYRDVTPEYPRWFLPCGKLWLASYHKDGTTFVDNAWDDDKNTFNFKSHEGQKFTSSSYQMFFYLHHGLEFVQNLGQEDQDVHTTYLEVFAEVIRALVQHYVDKVSEHIPQYVNDLETACMLLNNLQSLRVNVQALFSQIGGEKYPNVARTMQDFQSGVLSKEHSSWCVFVARSLTPAILKEVGMLQTELLKLKGQGGVERSQVKVIVRPLLDMLTEKARTIAVTCEQGIMQKVIKEVWYICMESLHRMLLPMLKWDQQEGVSDADAQFPKFHYSVRQCAALDTTMDILKDFFSAAGSQGVKLSTIDRGLKQLKGVIGLYKETTEMLITDFILEETSGGAQAAETFCGEVYVEVDAYSHPMTGELEGHIRVVCASGLSYRGISTQALRPLIELHLISPSMSTNTKRNFSTSSKNGDSPNYNENFKFSLANWEHSELQIMAKNHTTFGKDKLIGVAVLPFVSIIKEASLTLGLSPRLTLSDRGQAILNVLSVRTFDTYAKDFVALKDFHQRPASMEGLDP